jgi:hypothetical protein
MVLKTGKSNYYFHETSVIHYKGESTVRDEKYMMRFREAMHFFYKKHFKVSIIFDVFMKAGAFFFSFVKKSQAVVSKRVPGQYLLFSEAEKLRQQVEKLLGKKVARISEEPKNTINSLSSDQKRQTEIIFDNHFYDFKSIIAMMESYKNHGFTFKIYPESSNFIIGSNSSNDRGAVIKLR